ncbi:MAG TPA: isochorismatase family cysteine hydrolase [Solirubrobacterales bacterium]|jgi:nicotinamidase-related amidase|nr:isochorismatase family cysteine hydrolase [Gaiellaceae bacterium]HEU4803610.1 isochorismatase family cysteine hydrolase [Solirubrobacterales bacterium]
MSSGREGGATAVIVTDVLNPYEHDDADLLAASAATATPLIAQLIENARARDVDVIYVNDNHGEWNTSANEIGELAMNGRRPDLVEPLLPASDLAFMTKLRHSVFYATPLEYLLRDRGIGRVVLSGQVTEQCILYSALDAYVRHYEVTVPRDAVAHIHPSLADAALEMIERNMRGVIAEAADCLD